MPSLDLHADHPYVPEPLAIWRDSASAASHKRHSDVVLLALPPSTRSRVIGLLGVRGQSEHGGDYRDSGARAAIFHLAAGHPSRYWGIVLPYLAGRGTFAQIAGCVYCAGEFDGSTISDISLFHLFTLSRPGLVIIVLPFFPSPHRVIYMSLYFLMIDITAVWVVPVAPLTGQLKAFTNKCLDVPNGSTPSSVKHIWAGKNKCLNLTGGNSTNGTPVSVLFLFSSGIALSATKQ
ncbi:hypothetical protein C8J57DRAFT_1490018 [Mycena rebaudengoi]|nr:hypothetical protein C8J57DRAFT_1490018 [Mycena rebaudengoi]